MCSETWVIGSKLTEIYWALCCNDRLATVSAGITRLLPGNWLLHVDFSKEASETTNLVVRNPTIQFIAVHTSFCHFLSILFVMMIYQMMSDVTGFRFRDLSSFVNGIKDQAFVLHAIFHSSKSELTSYWDFFKKRK